jgi:SAM-dependent methyltransferase
MEDLLLALRAIGESTRLRIVAVLARSELTVGELCRVLGQTQPRVSRHLRLLCEAGLLDRNAQGTSAFYRPARAGRGRELFDAILPLIDDDDVGFQSDLRRLAAIRAERAKVAAAYFDLDVGHLLDVGTGTGRVLEVFAEHIDRGIGLDLSQQMLDLARSRLDQLGHRHCSVRQGNAYDLGLDAGSVDVAVLHHVLHYLDDPASSIAEAARTLRPGGRLLVVDFGAHNDEAMRADYAHHWLGFADDEVADWCTNTGLVDVTTEHLTLADIEDGLTVTLWIATQHRDAPALYNLEFAS